MTYKILFCGLGSIGKRHLINTIKYLEKKNSNCIIDLMREDVTKPLPKEMEKHINKVYSYSDSIEDHYDVVFITNPTSEHYKTLLKTKSLGDYFFIEKPVFDVVPQNSEIDLTSNKYYVACPLRYCSTIKNLHDNLDISKVISVRAVCSSYLPEWRPSVDYRKSYSAIKELGGGVEIDLIHEWDYLCYLFGAPNNVKSIVKKCSNLEISSNDVAIYIGESDNIIYELHLDYFGRKPIRQLYIFMEDETVFVDINNSKINYLCANKEITFEEERDDYQLGEIDYFFTNIVKELGNTNNIEKGLKTLKLAKGC
jgi:predicted dehydrogenase